MPENNTPPEETVNPYDPASISRALKRNFREKTPTPLRDPYNLSRTNLWRESYYGQSNHDLENLEDNED